MRELDDVAATKLLPQDANQQWCGFDPSGWSASCWILHAMYEIQSLPEGLSYDEVWRIEESAAPPTEDRQKAKRIRELLDRGTLVGSQSGKSERPPGPWSRLSWHELSLRLGCDPFEKSHLPASSSFPLRSWPVSIRPPAEGALDWEQYHRLLELLAPFSVDGLETLCVVRYGPCWDMERPYTFQATLREAIGQYDDPSQRGAPNNIWPEDKSWFIYTDYDLWGTKVSGGDTIIASIRQDPELETAPLPV